MIVLKFLVKNLENFQFNFIKLKSLILATKYINNIKNILNFRI